MRVAFTLIGDRSGTGGYNYLLNLLKQLDQYQRGQITPLLFVGTDADDKDIAPFSSLETVGIVRSALFNESRKARSQIQALLLGQDRAISSLLRANHVDVVFESARFFGRRLGIPGIAWITDFQHRYLPHMFTRGQYWRRELGFRAQVRAGRMIMLSSIDSTRSCERFYPRSIGHTRTVRFAVPARAAHLEPSARVLAAQYGLPPKFFFMPNQFWRHKNHCLVIEALDILRSRGVNCVVAASGKQDDTRDPDFFPSIAALVAKLDLAQQFRLVGHVPYDHLLGLMQASLALLNPSRFEGWSTSVEEARALGVPMVLSDLDVHREQVGGLAVYFDRTDPVSLADVLQAFVPVPDEVRERLAAKARAESALRVQTYAREFVQMVNDCVQTASKAH